MKLDLHSDQVTYAAGSRLVPELTLQQAIPMCLLRYRELRLPVQRELVVPFQFENCMVFISGATPELAFDVTVSAPVFLDVQIKSSHLNTRFVMNQMIARAVEVYGSDAQQDYAMGFLFRDGCGLVKSERHAGGFVNLIERNPIRLDYQIQFAVSKG